MAVAAPSDIFDTRLGALAIARRAALLY